MKPTQFDWIHSVCRGKEFYETMNYEQAGYYKNDMDNYEEYFFVKGYRGFGKEQEKKIKMSK